MTHPGVSTLAPAPPRQLAATLADASALVDERLTHPATWRGELRRERAVGRRFPASEAALARAFDEFAHRGQNAPFDEDTFVRVNELVRGTNGAALVAPSLELGFRTRQVAVRSRAQRFATPDHREVPALVARVFAAARSSDADPITLSAQVHLDLLRIHPFIDGNGRSARLMASAVLLRAGYRSTLMTAVEQHTATRPQEYFERFDTLETSGGRDVTAWVFGALEAMGTSLLSVRGFLQRRRALIGALDMVGCPTPWRVLWRFESARRLPARFAAPLLSLSDPWVALPAHHVARVANPAALARLLDEELGDPRASEPAWLRRLYLLWLGLLPGDVPSAQLGMRRVDGPKAM